MTVSNREVKRAARQIFASSRAIVTPFYNRERSKQEVATLFQNKDSLRGSTILIAAPMGTGKTFFIDQVSQTLGLAGRTRPLLVGEVSDKDLRGGDGDVLFVDEGDIKTNWSDLVRGIETIGARLKDSDQIGLVLGDFTLRNTDLASKLPGPRYIKTFEPLTEEFLRGVLDQRFKEYLNEDKGSETIEPELMRTLIPEGTAWVNSFRTILTFLESLTRTLPSNTKPFKLTLSMARDYIAETFEPVLTTQQQADFLNVFLDFLAANHPEGAGLGTGFNNDQLMILGKQTGYDAWSTFRDEIVDPFGEQGFLLGRGIPALDDTSTFARWREPFYPSLHLLLLAGP